jgi:pimeloyl-ACP methyl ester carboxylesterase
MQGRRLECRWFEPHAPLAQRQNIVMLHEGLGSLAMWKEFPQQLADATGARVVAYSRFGYGNSDPAARQPIATQMHEDEALNILPEVLRALDIERPLLLGHSDGASIALIYSGANPDDVCGVIAMAPHVFVEDMCIASIEGAREAYLRTDLPRRLGRYHRDPDGAFWLWNRVWLDPLFRDWNIEHYLPSIRCPVLLIQGHQDEYGTMEQLERICRSVKGGEALKLDDCRHSPHRDRPAEVLAAIRRFMDERVLAAPADSTATGSARD